MHSSSGKIDRRTFLRGAAWGGAAAATLCGLSGPNLLASAPQTARTSTAPGIPLTANSAETARTGRATSNPTWESLRSGHTPVPDWMRDAKFGIYCHWGVYSVPDYDSEHYENRMYNDSGYTKYGTHERQIAIYGPLEKFGYHDFIPMFTASRFDAAQWADIFQKAGARFAGPVAEHEDGFSMWDSRVTPFNAKAMGPHRDVVGELERAIRARGLKFFTSMHNGVNYTNVKMKRTWAGAGPRFAKLYGSSMEHDRWFAMWQAKAIEVADKYLPDVMYHDVGLDTIPDLYKERYIAHYFDLAAAHGRQVIVTYKKQDIPPGIGMLDHESSHPREIIDQPWLCDYTIGTGLSPSWSYTDLIELRTPSEILHTLIEVVANNGQMLLNLSPRASGEIPEDQRRVVLKVGEWLWSFGESIYGTRPFAVATEILKNGQQVFYTRKGRFLYIIVLSWPGKGSTLTLRDLTPNRLETHVASAHLFGLRQLELCTFVADGSGVQVTLPANTGQPSELASVIRLELE